MARLRWVVAMLREWAVWVDSDQPIHGVLYGEVSGGTLPGAWLPKDARTARRAHKAVCKLPSEHAEMIVLVYLKGPRQNAVTLPQIADFEGMNLRTLRRKIESAEVAFSEALESLSEGDDAID